MEHGRNAIDGWEGPQTGSPPTATSSQRRRDCIVLFTLAGPQQGAVVTLHERITVIGRDGSADVQLDDDTVSGTHARLTLAANGAVLEDLGSTNGTFLNGNRVAGRRPVVDGDHMRFGGSTVIKFAMMDALEERALSTLFALSLRDPLTHLYNRRYFQGRLNAEFSFARRHGTLLALLLFDLDHFKAINDDHGHQVGDTVLKIAAGTIERLMRPEDVLARFGGDELVVIARATSRRNAEILAERICRHVAQATVLPGRDLAVTVSAGVAAMGPGSEILDAERLLSIADEALYCAKARGRNRVVARASGETASVTTEPPSRRTQPPEK